MKKNTTKTHAEAIVEAKTPTLKLKPASLITLEGTTVYQKSMNKQFSVEAMAYAVIDEKGETITYVNSYKGVVPASYSPAPYTFQFKGEKTIKKLEKKEWVEVDATDWPSFVTAGTRKRTKAK